jgi:hypothetical protein
MIIDQVRAAVGRWREFAEQAQVPVLKAAEVGEVLRAGSAERRRIGPSI